MIILKNIILNCISIRFKLVIIFKFISNFLFQADETFWQDFFGQSRKDDLMHDVFDFCGTFKSFFFKFLKRNLCCQ